MPDRPRRLGIRARLTWTYTGLLVASALVVLAGVWVMLAIIPGYEFTYGPYPSAFWPVVDVKGKSDVLRLFALASIPLVVVIGLIGWVVSYLVAGRVLRPLTELTALVRSIDEKSLNTRLDLHGPADEIGILASTFDKMLARLEASFEINARFAANAAHELRTPLATTKTVLHVARRQSAGDEVMTRTLEQLSGVNEQMISMTASLLDLTSASQRPLNDKVDLMALVESALAENHADIARRRLDVCLRGQAVHVAGDADLLARGISNLVRNAVRHNIDGGYIDVSVNTTQSTATITLSNSGADLSGVDLESLTEPFVRAEQRLRRDSDRAEGHGLGLALVRTIATLHEAELQLSLNAPNGLTATLTMPKL